MEENNIEQTQRNELNGKDYKNLFSVLLNVDGKISNINNSQTILLY